MDQTAADPITLRVWADISKIGGRLFFPLDVDVRCPTPIVLESRNGRVVLKPCGRRSCPVCGLRLRAELLARIELGAQVEAATFGRQPFEFTLTLPPDVDELHGLSRREVYAAEQAASRLLLKRVRQRVRRRGDKRPLLVFRSREVQPDRGSVAPHWIWWGEFFDELSYPRRVRLLEDAGFGKIHHLSPVESLANLSSYYSKYINKQAGSDDPQFRLPSGVKAYGYSPDLMPDRKSWNDYRLLCYRCPDEGVEVVSVGGPAGAVRLDRESRWWRTAAWAAAREARWWDQPGTFEPEPVDGDWVYAGQVTPTSELRFGLSRSVDDQLAGS